MRKRDVDGHRSSIPAPFFPRMDRPSEAVSDTDVVGLRRDMVSDILVLAGKDVEQEFGVGIKKLLSQYAT